MDNGTEAAAVAALAAAAGLVIGANRDKVVELLSPPVQWIGKTAGGAAKFVLSHPVRCIGKMAGAAFGGAFRLVLQQKEALEDKIAEARVKFAVQ